MVNAPARPILAGVMLCGAHFLGHLSPQQEMTGLAVGPCCTAVAHRTFPAAPFAASAGDRSMDAWHPPCITPRTTTPITMRRGVMLPPPPPPASARCPQAADPPRASGACLDAPRLFAVPAGGANWRCGRRSAGRSRMCGESGDGTNNKGSPQNSS